MPIISNFPGGSGSGHGLTLAAVSDIVTQLASGRIYVKWKDPKDIIADGVTLAEWGGTLLVRKAGSVPKSRRDGAVVLDSKVRNQYSDTYFCDSGLANGETYYYKFFPYTTLGAYTENANNEFSVTPTAQVVGIDSWVVTGMVASTEAGDGKINLKWTDPANTITLDGLTLATWGNTTVVVKEGSYPTGKDDADAVYTFRSTTRNQYATSPLTIDGLTNGKTYYIGCFPETTDGYVNTNKSQTTTGIANRITIKAQPTQSGTLTYTGNLLIPTWSNYSAEQVTLSGTTSGINAGSYTASFTPNIDYRWSDGSIGAKNVKWSIGKAERSISLSATSVVLNADATSATVTVTYLGDGQITAVSNNAGVIAVKVNGTSIVISSVGNVSGLATITVSVGEGTNYKASAGKTIDVAAAFGMLASTTPRSGMTYTNGISDLDTATLNQISEAISRNSAITDTTATVYIDYDNLHRAVSVGDTVLMQHPSISGGTQLTVLGFNHDNLTNTLAYGDATATGKAGMTLISQAVVAGPMNQSATNYGGWYSSAMRNSTIATLYNAAPSTWKGITKSVNKITGLGGGSSDGTQSSAENWFILSEVEVWGSQTLSVSGEGNQYAYYRAGNPKVIKTSSGVPVSWWTRSPVSGNGESFCVIMGDGDPVRVSASNHHYNYIALCI